MMRSICRWLGVMAGTVVVLMATTASAQVIGTFRWQFAPYCNVVTLRVEQEGTQFALTGTDDQCGAPVAAAASGTAHVNPNGTIGLALTVVRPDGLTLASSATLDLATISGAWKDEYANSGTFVFNPPGPAGGAPRHITLTGTYAINFLAAQAAAQGAASFSFGRTLPNAPQVVNNIVPVSGAPTTNCPGSVADPRALPGQLCIYEASVFNSAARFILKAGGNEGADPSGALVLNRSAAAGLSGASGRWAVTIP